MVNNERALTSLEQIVDRMCGPLLRRGELDGNRVLGTRTVDYMARNHLPGGVDLEFLIGSSGSEVLRESH